MIDDLVYWHCPCPVLITQILAQVNLMCPFILGTSMISAMMDLELIRLTGKVACVLIMCESFAAPEIPRVYVVVYIFIGAIYHVH